MRKLYKILFIVITIFITDVSYAQQPNIIVIIADDLGNGDVGYNGGTQIPTPNIDALANEGVVFSNGYVTASNCGPSRAGIVTGRYQNRFGFESLPDPLSPQLPGAEPAGVPLSQKTIGRYMKDLGYNTKAIGKWHVGGKGEEDRTLVREYTPLARGFDEFFGFLGGAMGYYPKATSNFIDGENFITEDLNEYLTDAIAREAVEFIEAKKNDPNPFFIYMAFNAVHLPFGTKQVDLDRFADEPDENRRNLCAMMYSMDENIGKVLTKLEEEGLTDNTLIVFISDNGGAPEKNYSYNTPYREGKSYTFEGGIRLPFLIKWPGHITPNIVYDPKTIGIDILPTIIKAAGGTITAEDKFDGKDLLPYINNEVAGTPHEFLYWRRYLKPQNPEAQWAVRDDNWKLVYNTGVEFGARPMLFNISVDPSETNDLYEQEPEQVKRLQAKWDEWDADNIIPLWGAGYDLAERELKKTFNRTEDFEAGTIDNPDSEYTWYATNSVVATLVPNPIYDAVNSSSTCVELDKTDYTKGMPSYTMKDMTFDFVSNKILKFKVYRPGDVSSVLDIYISNDGDRETDIRLGGISLVGTDSGWLQYEIDLTDELLAQNQPEGFNNQLRFIFGSGRTKETAGKYYLDDVDFVSNTLSSKTVMLGPIKVVPTIILDNVRLESSDKIISVRVYDMIGQLREEFRDNDIRTISLGKLNSGNYILDIETTNGRESVQVIKK